MTRSRFAVLSSLTGAAMIVAAAAAAALGALGHAAWGAAFAVAVALLGVRVGVLAWGAARRELPWSRLLLPAIVLIEAAGWRGAATLWQVRLGTAVVLELAFVGIAIRAVRRATMTDGAEPPEARIARALAALLPARAARLVAFELVIVGSALRFVAGGWRRAVPAGFPYHRESGLGMLLPVLPLLGVADVLLLELVLLPHAAPWLRAVVHGLGIYALVWLVGLYASLRERPHQLAGGLLTLHRGILGRLTIPVDQIASISALPSFADDWKRRAYCEGALRLDVAGPSILELHLRAAARPIGVLGDGAASTRVLVAVDDPGVLIAAVEHEASVAISRRA